MENWRHAIAKSLSSSKRFLFAVVGFYLSALYLTDEHLYKTGKSEATQRLQAYESAYLLLFCFNGFV